MTFYFMTTTVDGSVLDLKSMSRRGLVGTEKTALDNEDDQAAADDAVAVDNLNKPIQPYLA
jgi:hypothetical protein